MTTTRTLSDEAQKVFDLLGSAKVGMLVTGADSGSPLRARPMALVEVDRKNMVVRMFTHTHSIKEDELERDNRANFCFMDSASQRYVSISGLVTCSRDPDLKMRLWKPLQLAWFPGGPDDPELMVLEFKIAGGDYWDAPSNRLVQAFGIAKAIVTGTTYAPGEVGHMGHLH